MRFGTMRVSHRIIYQNAHLQSTAELLNEGIADTSVLIQAGKGHERQAVAGCGSDARCRFAPWSEERRRDRLGKRFEPVDHMLGILRFTASSASGARGSFMHDPDHWNERRAGSPQRRRTNDRHRRWRVMLGVADGYEKLARRAAGRITNSLPQSK